MQELRSSRGNDSIRENELCTMCLPRSELSRPEVLLLVTNLLVTYEGETPWVLMDLADFAVFHALCNAESVPAPDPALRLDGVRFIVRNIGCKKILTR